MTSAFSILVLFSVFINVSSLRMNNVDVSSEVNLIFYAGVEGSGHHLLEQITEELWRHNKVHSFFSAQQLKLPDEWGCGVKWDHSAFQDVVQQWKALKPGNYILPQQMSFPMCGRGRFGDGKGRVNTTIDHDGRTHSFFPRIDWMQTAADQAGVKLHILYLYRDLFDCLAADCLHRQFENCTLETEELFYNSHELMTQLQSIPKGKYSCFFYGDVDMMKSAVAETFGPEFEDSVQTIYSEHPPEGLREEEKNWNNFEAKLKDINLEMKEACAGASSISLSEIFSLFEPRGATKV